MDNTQGVDISPFWWKDVTFPSGLTEEQLTKPSWFHRLKPGQVIHTSLGEEYMYGQYMGEFDLAMGARITVVTEPIDDETELYTFFPTGVNYFMGFMMMDVKPKQWCIARRVLPTIASSLIANTDYNTLSNKPSINGNEIIGDKTGTELGVSNIYMLDNSLPLSELQLGYDLLNTIIDFSGLTDEMFSGYDSYCYYSITRAVPEQQDDMHYFNYLTISNFYDEEGMQNPICYVNGGYTMAPSGFIPTNSTKVFTFNTETGHIEWDPAFPHNKKYKFTTFTELPDSHDLNQFEWWDVWSKTLGNVITAASGNDRLGVDCEFLHGQMGNVTASLDSKSDIYKYPDNTLYGVMIQKRSMLGLIFDFSEVTPAMLENINYVELRQSTEVLAPTYTQIRYWLQLGTFNNELRCYMMSTMGTGQTTPSGQLVFRYTKGGGGDIIWSNPNKTFTTPTSYVPLYRQTVYSSAYGGSSAQAFMDTVKVKDLRIYDAAALFGSITGAITGLSDMGEKVDNLIPGQLNSKSYIYNTTIDGTPTAVDCQWLYTNGNSAGVPTIKFTSNPATDPVEGVWAEAPIHVYGTRAYWYYSPDSYFQYVYLHSLSLNKFDAGTVLVSYTVTLPSTNQMLLDTIDSHSDEPYVFVGYCCGSKPAATVPSRFWGWVRTV